MSATDRRSVAGEARAWGWVAHLRDGGTTPWSRWDEPGPAAGRQLPGAQQLELLRRLNLAGRPTPALAERVLEASAPGRGRPDLELEGAVERLRFGPAPVDPATLPAEELLRVATGLVAEDLAARETSAPAAGLLRPWRTRYRLVGDPELADPARAALVARGRPPGGSGSVVLVLGTDLGRMLVDAWTARTFTEGGPPWREWLGTFVGRARLPARADVALVADRWVDRVGETRVRLVLDQAALPRLVGVRRLDTRQHPVSGDGTELARRVSAVLGLLAGAQRREALLRQVLRPRLAALGGAPLVVPPEHERWLHRRAVRMRDHVRAAGYAVVGDPDLLLPRGDAGVPEPSDEGTLGVAMTLLLDGLDTAREGTPGGPVPAVRGTDEEGMA